jgi:hypothetical protein
MEKNVQHWSWEETACLPGEILVINADTWVEVLQEADPV